MDLRPVPNTVIRSDNVWLSWFRDIRDWISTKLVKKIGDTMSGNLVISQADGTTFGAVSAATVGNAGIAMISSPLTYPPYGVNFPGSNGLYANSGMWFLADSGSPFSWGWPNFAMGLSRTAPGGVESANLTVGSSLPNIFLYGNPFVGLGSRIHFTELLNLTVLDSTGEFQFRSGSGAMVFGIDPNRRTISLRPLTSDPPSPADGEIWNLNGTLRKRSGGVTSNL